MKRFLKIVLILALFTVAIAYVLFRVLFFDPFGSARPELDSMIPADVDVMFRRRELDKDFEPFPLPRFWKALRIKDDWEAFARTRLFKEYEPKLGVEAIFKEAEKVPDQLKPLELMADLAGREVMVVGKWRSNGTLAFAAFLRASFRSKFLAEAVKFSLGRKVAGDLIQSYEEKDGVRSLKVAGASWHLFRVDDVLVAGNDFDLVKQIRGLAEGGGARSMFDSPLYRTAVLGPQDVGRTFDFVLDVADAAKNLGWRWPPPPPAEPVVDRFLRELLVPDRFGLTMGRLALGNQADLSFHATADYATLRPAAGGLLDAPSMDVADMWKFCGAIFPAEVAVAGYVRFDVKQFLRRIEGLLEPDLRNLMNDAVAQLRSPDRQLQPKSTVELLDTFAALVGNELAFAVEPDAPYHVPGTPDNQFLIPNPEWGPRVALILPVADKDLCEQFVDRVWKAIQGKQGIVDSAWTWSYPNGQKFREIKFVSAAVDLPTISIGFLQLEKRECVVITTTGKFLDDVVKQKARVDAGSTADGLMAELPYKQAKEASKGFGQGFVFVSSSRLRQVVSDFCPVFAANSTRPDWTKVRKEVERAQSNRLFHGKGPATDTEKKELETAVDAEIEKRDKDWRENILEQTTEALRADVEGLAFLRWATLAWRVNERDLEVRLRASTAATFPND
jgi:hypothetical protein